MPYDRLYLETTDLDWFVQVNNRCIHAASGGGIIPNIVIQNDEKNMEIRNRVIGEPSKNYKFELNPHLRNILNLEDRKEDIAFLLSTLGIEFGDDPIQVYIDKVYVNSFVEFAKKGFWSFDKTNVQNYSDRMYHLVARPVYSHHMAVYSIEGSSLYTNEKIKIITTKCFDLVTLINNIDF